MQQSLPAKLKDPQLVKKYPAFLWNPNVRYHIYKSTLPVPILSQIDQVLAPSYLSKMHFNIILPSKPRFFKCLCTSARKYPLTLLSCDDESLPNRFADSPWQSCNFSAISVAQVNINGNQEALRSDSFITNSIRCGKGIQCKSAPVSTEQNVEWTKKAVCMLYMSFV